MILRNYPFESIHFFLKSRFISEIWRWDFVPVVGKLCFCFGKIFRKGLVVSVSILYSMRQTIFNCMWRVCDFYRFWWWFAFSLVSGYCGNIISQIICLSIYFNKHLNKHINQSIQTFFWDFFFVFVSKYNNMTQGGRCSAEATQLTWQMKINYPWSTAKRCASTFLELSCHKIWNSNQLHNQRY